MLGVGGPKVKTVSFARRFLPSALSGCTGLEKFDFSPRGRFLAYVSEATITLEVIDLEKDISITIQKGAGSKYLYGEWKQPYLGDA